LARPQLRAALKKAMYFAESAVRVARVTIVCFCVFGYAMCVAGKIGSRCRFFPEFSVGGVLNGSQSEAREFVRGQRRRLFHRGDHMSGL
jgi:hypothetical protein